MDNQELCSLFENYLKVERRTSLHTVVAYKTDLTQFSNHLSNLNPSKIFTTATVQDIRGWLVSLAKEGLSNRSINRKMVAIRSFYAFLQKKEIIAYNYSTHQLNSLKEQKSLPIFFQKKELVAYLDQYKCDGSFANLRDKLILELLYGTGMRLAELLTLQVKDINLSDGTLKVVGKRNKERIIPFPRLLKGIIEAYVAQKVKLGYYVDQCIVTDQGKPAYPMFIYRIVRKYLLTTIKASQHSPHILRHTFATHLLDNGADLQAIKELLGHTSLSATQVYTHNSLTKLKEVFKKAHPRAEAEK